MACSKQLKIKSFFGVERDISSKGIDRPILNELINDVLKQNKSHTCVNKSTIENWKQSFPWLEILQNTDEVRLKCSFCTKFNSGSVWALDGAQNIQRSAIDRYGICMTRLSLKKLYACLYTTHDFLDK